MYKYEQIVDDLVKKATFEPDGIYVYYKVFPEAAIYQFNEFKLGHFKRSRKVLKEELLKFLKAQSISWIGSHYVGAGWEIEIECGEASATVNECDMTDIPDYMIH